MRKILTALHSISGWLEKHRILEKNLANSIARNHNSSLPNEVLILDDEVWDLILV